MMAIRRRVLMGQNQTYVKNGLLYHFVSDDSDGQTWTDRISGLTFTLSGVTKTQDNGLFFDGHAFGFIPSAQLPKIVTVEIVLSQNARDAIFLFDKKYVAADYQNAIRFDNIFLKGLRYEPELGEKYVISGTSKGGYLSSDNSIIYFNKSRLTGGSYVGTYSRFYDGISIGGRLTAQGQLRDNALKGTLYQIRLYSRDLTEQEILHNQNVDFKKYGIMA